MKKSIVTISQVLVTSLSLTDALYAERECKALFFENLGGEKKIHTVMIPEDKNFSMGKQDEDGEATEPFDLDKIPEGWHHQENCPEFNGVSECTFVSKRKDEKYFGESRTFKIYLKQEDNTEVNRSGQINFYSTEGRNYSYIQFDLTSNLTFGFKCYDKENWDEYLSELKKKKNE